MIELFVIVVLCGLLGWKEYQGRKERKELIQAIVSRNAAELANLQYIDKVKLTPEKTNTQTDLTPVDQLSEEDFQKYILEQQG